MSARILNAVSGLDPIPTNGHRLYLLLAGLFARIVPGGVNFNLNLFSAIFAALSLFIFYRFILQIPLVLQPHPPVAPQLLRRLRRLQAATAVLFFALCLPFWHSATRPGPVTFDFFLFLACFHLVIGYARGLHSLNTLFGVAFLYGLGITEYPTMIPFAPLFGIIALIGMLRRNELSARNIAIVILAGFVGLLFYLESPLRMMTTGWGYGEFDGFLGVLVDLWRKQYIELKRSIPQVAGLLIVLGSYAPLLYVYLVPKPRFHDDLLNRFLSGATLLLLTGLGIALLAEIRFSPYNIMGRQPILLPYLAIALWMGYLCAYWWNRSVIRQGGANTIHKLGSHLWKIAAAAILVAIFALPFFTQPFKDLAVAREYTAYAKAVMASCKPSSVLITGGGLNDDLIRYYSSETHKDLVVVAARDLAQKSTRNHLRRQLQWLDEDFVDGTDQPIESLLRSNPDGIEGCAFTHPDFATSLGYFGVPSGLVTVPAHDLTEVSPEELWSSNMSMYAASFESQISRLPQLTGTNVHQLRISLQREYSRWANNLGTTLRLLHADAHAQEAYQLAVNILPDNPSALLNLRSVYLAEQERNPTAQAEVVKERASELLAQAHDAVQRLDRNIRDPLTMLSVYGQVYSEQISLMLATHSRIFGMADAEAAAINQARLINPSSPAVIAGEAILLMKEGNEDAASEKYEAVLDNDPSNITARLGLAAIYAGKTNLPEAIAILTAPEVDSSNTSIQGFLAVLQVRSGDIQSAQMTIDRFATNATIDALSASLIATASYEAGDVAQAETLAQKVLRTNPWNVPMAQMLLEIARRKGDNSLILARLKHLQAQAPSDVSILEEIAKLAMNLNREQDAKAAALRLVSLQPNSFVGNMVLTTIEDKPRIVESYYKRAITNKDHPFYSAAINNYAYFLIEQDRPAEALPLAEEAVRLQQDHTFHHTLAQALLALDQLDRAEQHMLIASTLAPNPKYTLGYGQILILKGEREKGRDIIAQVLPELDDKSRTMALRILKSAE